ncbi:MAG: protein GlmU [Desulfobacterales bacterium]|nr:protein GlmU [Desulfobacterales bacterium]
MIKQLIEKGASVGNPESIEIGPEVNPERVAGQGVVIHSGSRIRGSETLICQGAQIGEEAPTTVENCYIGPEVSLKGGYFKYSVFLKKSSVGSCAHIRDGTILEEEASAAHSVGLKQTILFPFVTLGSLINFCDCLMAGGSSRKNHSEVGSSYIHFNFTPQQDKATPSLIGDVARGVMINQPPVFLGGQGGLVGPCRLAYGTVVAAGTINRKDETRPGRLIFGGPGRSGNAPYDGRMLYRNIKRIVANNLYYIASLKVLRHWYWQVRSLFISEMMPELLFKGLVQTLEGCIEERIGRLGEFAARMPESAENYKKIAGEKASGFLLRQKKQLCENWQQLEADLRTPGAEAVESREKRDRFIDIINNGIRIYGKNDYIRVVQSLDSKHAEAGAEWLQEITEALVERWLSFIPEFQSSI